MPDYRIYIHVPDILNPYDPGYDTVVTTNAVDEEEARRLVKAVYGQSVTIKRVEEAV